MEGIIIKAHYKGVTYIVLSAMSFAIMPIFAKFAYKGGISPTTLLSLRFLLASVLLFLYLIIVRATVLLKKKDLLYLFLLGSILYSATSILYFSSIKYIHISLTVLLMYTHPMLVAILSMVFDRERLTPQIFISMLVAFVGIGLILGNSISTNMNTLGILLAIGSAISYSMYIFISSRVIKKVPPIVATAYVSLFAAFGMMGIGMLQLDLSWEFSITVWLPLMGLIFVSTILALLFFLRGIEILGATKSTIISMFEPVFAVLFSYIIFKEALTTIQLVGGAFVLCGAIMVIMIKKKAYTTDKSIENTTIGG